MSRSAGPRIPAAAVALTLAAFSMAGCGDAPAEAPQVRVVATTTILGDVARNVVGDSAEIEVLIPLGADPHAYQASSRQASSLAGADLVVANGLGLEEGLADVLESAADDGARVLWVGEHLDPLPFASDHDPEEADHDDEESDHEHGNLDPHVWLDPLRMAEAARLIAAQLEAAVPGHGWADRAEAYAAELTALDGEIQTILDGVPPEARKLVTNHHALGYFADRYGFEMVGTVIPGGSTQADPSSAELAALVATIEREGVRAIFGETTDPSALADAVAAELGEDIAVVNLYTGSLGEPGSGAETLIDMLRTNAGLIAGALS